jgi:hypothetical protein
MIPLNKLDNLQNLNLAELETGPQISTKASELANVDPSVLESSVASKAAQIPLENLNQFAVETAVTSPLLSSVANLKASVLKNPFTDITNLIGDNSTSDLGGSSIEAVLLELASKERGQLADKVNQLKNLQVPGANATPQQQADYDSQKVNLMADIQSIQNSIQQITTMATNVQKNDNDTNMSIVRNMA